MFGLSNARAIWNQFREHFCNDLRHCLQRYRSPPEGLDHLEWDLGLFLLHDMLQKREKSATQFHLPQYQHEWETVSHIWLIPNELDYSLSEQAIL